MTASLDAKIRYLVERDVMKIKLHANITCPQCRFVKEEQMLPDT